MTLFLRLAKEAEARQRAAEARVRDALARMHAAGATFTGQGTRHIGHGGAGKNRNATSGPYAQGTEPLAKPGKNGKHPPG
jgi:hypothetical protein